MVNVYVCVCIGNNYSKIMVYTIIFLHKHISKSINNDNYCKSAEVGYPAIHRYFKCGPLLYSTLQCND